MCGIEEDELQHQESLTRKKENKEKTIRTIATERKKIQKGDRKKERERERKRKRERKTQR